MYNDNYISNLILEKNASLELAEITSNEILKIASDNKVTPEDVLYEIGLEKAASFANDLIVYLNDLQENGYTLDEDGNEIPLQVEEKTASSDDFTEELIKNAREKLYGN